MPGYTGIDHFGFQVKDIDEIRQKLDEAGPSEIVGLDLGHAGGTDGQSYHEHKYRGPGNQAIDAAATRWIGV